MRKSHLSLWLALATCFSLGACGRSSFKSLKELKEKALDPQSSNSEVQGGQAEEELPAIEKESVATVDKEPEMPTTNEPCTTASQSTLLLMESIALADAACPPKVVPPPTLPPPTTPPTDNPGQSK